MKVLLIYPNITDYPIDISSGLASISSFLKANKQIVKLHDMTFDRSIRKLTATIKSFSPEIIGIPVASNDYQFVTMVCSYIKKVTAAPVVCGGFYPSVLPEIVIKEKNIDFVISGEGEKTFLELISAIENKTALNNIKGLVFKENNKIIKNEIRPYTVNIHDFPFPDKEFFDYKRYIKVNRGLATFLSSYGCPYKCSYCINHSSLEKYGSSYVRFKPIPYFINEIKDVLKKFRINAIELYDETFTVNKNRVIEFCDLYYKEIAIPFTINARVDTIDENILSALKRAGCTRISMGIETGDEFVRNEILKRNQTDKQIIEAFTLVKQSGIKTHSYNMIGIPFEDRNSINKTIELNRLIKPDFLAVSIFNAYPGTEIYNICKEKGWLTDECGLSYFKTSNIKHPQLSLNELIRLRDNFGFYVFKDHNLKRAVIDAVDKRLLKHRLYVFIRSMLIQKGIKKIL